MIFFGSILGMVPFIDYDYSVLDRSTRNGAKNDWRILTW